MRSETSTLGVKKIRNLGITVIELVIVITLLAIMSTILFISLGSYNKYARNTERVNNIANIKSAIELSFTETGYYPVPDSSTGITYSGSVVWTQGTFGKDAKRAAKAISEVPTDPLTLNEYTYSITSAKTEYELGGAIEGSLAQTPPASLHSASPSIEGDRGGVFADSSDLKSYISGKYNAQVLKVSTGSIDYVLAVPSIIASDLSDTNLVNIVSNKKLSVKGFENLPHSYGVTKTAENDADLKFVNPEKLVVFSGSFEDLKTKQATRVLLAKNIAEAYFGTLLTNIGEISPLTSASIDTDSPSTENKKLADETVIYRLGLKLKEEVAGDPRALPTDLRDLFKSDSIYTKNWQTNACNPATMTVVNVAPGTDTIPATLSANTIYKLTSGNYITSRTINLNNCSAIIGNGNSNLFSSVYLSSGMIYVASKNNTILNGLKVDGESNGVGGSHGKNGQGIGIMTSNNNTLNGIESYNNAVNGVAFGSNAINNIVNASTFYNNNIGININTSSGNILKEIKCYNNNSGVNFSHSNNNILTNVISYNNGGDGIYLYGNNNYNTLNNTLTFNNNRGIFINSSISVVINNSLSFNTINQGLVISTLANLLSYNFSSYNNLQFHGIGFAYNANSNSKYYGKLKLFQNSYGNFYGTNGNDSFLSPGTDGLNSSLNLPNGTLDTSGTFDQSWAVIPNVAGWDYTKKGQQCKATDTCANKNLTGDFDENTTFTFGANIPNQTRPIKWNSTTSQFEYYGVDGVDYDSTKKIGQW